MADTTALKNRIRAAIKDNNNQEITGPVLQQALLDIVDELNGATETEANARQNGDSTLQQAINTESQRAQEVEQNLLNTVSNLSNSLELEEKLMSGVNFIGGKTVLTGISNKSGKTLYIYIVSNTDIPEGGIEVYRNGSYDAADKIIITQANTKYQFTPSGNQDIRLYANYANTESIKADISIIDSESSFAQSVENRIKAIDSEAQARQSADTQLNSLITGIKNNIDNGYVYAGIATPSSTPTTGKVFYLALTAGTYTNYGNTEVSQGINILKYNGSAWSLDAFIGIDDEPTPNSLKLVRSGGVQNKIDNHEYSVNLTKGLTFQSGVISKSNTTYLVMIEGVQIPSGGVVVYLDGEYSSAEAVTITEPNKIYKFTPSNSKEIRLYNNTGVEIQGDAFITIAKETSIAKSLLEFKESYYSQQGIITEITNRLSNILVTDVVPIPANNGNRTGLTPEAGKTYKVYVPKHVLLPSEGIAIYENGKYEQYKVLITESGVVYDYIGQTNPSELSIWNESSTSNIPAINIEIATEGNYINEIYKIQQKTIYPSLQKLKATTWNVGYWNNGVQPYGVPDADVDTILPRVRALLTTICADIMVATEWVEKFDRSQTMDAYNLLLKQFYPYKYTRENARPAIFSKYPIIGSVGNFVSGQGTYSKGIIKIGTNEVVIVGVHLPANEQDRTLRMQMISDIITEYADSPYVIFIGDTNIYNTDELQAFITAGWVLGNCGYWGNIDTWYTGTWPIDNVITKGFGIDNFKKIEDDTRAGVSDHYPVVADISSYM